MRLSEVLDSMGVVHINEAEVGYGYIADILIPEPVIGAPNGIIIEADGPFHFESYIQKPVGPTVMKRRHMAAMGYHVISVPLNGSWQAIHKDSNKIQSVLAQVLQQARKGRRKSS